MVWICYLLHIQTVIDKLCSWIIRMNSIREVQHYIFILHPTNNIMSTFHPVLKNGWETILRNSKKSRCLFRTERFLTLWIWRICKAQILKMVHLWKLMGLKSVHKANLRCFRAPSIPNVMSYRANIFLLSKFNLKELLTY